MTRKSVTDEQYGQLNRRVDELMRRVDEKTIPLNRTMAGLQMLIEGRFVEPSSRTDVIGAKRQTFKVLVDYTISLEEMIKAGRYKHVSSDITSDHFPITGIGQKEVEVVLFHFNRVISFDKAIVEMEEQGFRPADPLEILALGAKYQGLQRQFPIAALRSPWQDSHGHCIVLCLGCWGDGESSLSRRLFGPDWHEDYRFAAVRK